MMSLGDSAAHLVMQSRRKRLAMDEQQHAIFVCGRLWDGTVRLSPTLLQLPQKIAVRQVSCGSLSLILPLTVKLYFLLVVLLPLFPLALELAVLIVTVALMLHSHH